MASKKQIADLHAKLTADIRQYVTDMQTASKETRATERSITGSFAKASQATKTFNEAQNVMGKSSRANGMMIQQAGYQVGDFAVQVASGQSALRAFIQQGSQMLGVFGPAGAIAGAALAIGGVVANLVMAGDETDKAAEKLKTYEEYARQLHETMEKIRFEALRPTQQRDELAADIEKKKADLRELWDLHNRLMAAPKALRYNESLPNGLSQQELDLRLFRQGAVDEAMAQIGKAQNELRDLKTNLEKLDGEITTSAAKDATELRKEYAALFDLGKEWQEQLSENHKKAATSALKEQESIERLAEKYRQIADPLRIYRQQIEEVQQLQDRGTLSAEESAAAIAGIEEAMRKLKERMDEEPMSKSMREEMAAMEERAKYFQNAMNGMFQDVSNRAGDAFAEMVLTGENAFDSLVDTVARSMIRIAAQMAIVNPIMNAVFGGFGGFVPLPAFWGAGAAGAAAAPVGVPAASGGYRDGTKPYLVGEEGPEMFYPGRAGTILPAKETASLASGPTYIINAPGATEQTVQRIEQALFQLAGPGVVERRAMSALADSRRRGGMSFA